MHLTISELVSHTKRKIDDLHSIVDVLITQYKTAAEVINVEVDPRQKYVEQLQELNSTICNIVDTHPSMGADRISVNSINRLIEISEGLK